MNIWILTIGSSDIQLKTKTNWTKLFRDVRSQLDDRGFTPSDAIEQRFQVPARVLGVVYSQQQAEQHFDDLFFPLIDNFLSEIKDQPIDKIILVLGDQSIFQPAERSSQNHAYWQDTCTLQPLLEKYLKQKLEKSPPELQFQPSFLRPTSIAEGLDDWNAVLKLVQSEFSSLEFPDDATIYVSHQAGTPAISSAVQFTSLSRFGQQVKFLVSNERNSKLTRVLDSSEYLKGIRKQEAKTLLERHNYSGVKELLAPYLIPEVEILLKAAVQWNCAEFKKFADELRNCSNQNLKEAAQERTKEENWWWSAYESAYLAVVRLKQKNTVEAMFHSFRAVEGVIGYWSKQEYPDDIKDRKGKPVAILRSSSKLPQYLIEKLQGCKDYEMALYGESLFQLLRESKPELQENEDTKAIWKSAKSKRNDQFHQLLGLDEKGVFQAWGMNSQSSWEIRLRNCLNLIANQEHFTSIEKASLMAKVHEELKKAIAHL